MRNITSQRGSTLGISLIFLVLLTLLGITAMQDTTMQERMAGNARDKEIAFQAAEAALLDAEQFLENPVLPAFTGGALMEYRTDGAQATAWVGDDHDWDADDSRSYTGDSIDGVVSLPRYAIEQLPPTQLPGQSLAADTAPVDTRAYRITVRAEGGTTDAVALLQSVYRR